MKQLMEFYMEFLYSQDLSNYKTKTKKELSDLRFLYSQDLSNYKTSTSAEVVAV